MLPPRPRRLPARRLLLSRMAVVGGVLSAGAVGALRWPPSRRICPPARTPETSTVAADRLMLLPASTWTAPPSPASAVASTAPETATSCAALTVTSPPLSAPETSSLPVAVWVTVSAVMLTRPPLRLAPATTGSVAAAPLAEMVPLFTTTGAVTLTSPAGLPSRPASALTVPVFSTRSEASRTILPPFMARPVASSLPLLRTMPPCRRSTARADRMMTPPGATTAPLFSTRALILEGSTTMPARLLLPSNCRVTRSPEASATVPIRATITPSLRTSGASRAM